MENGLHEAVQELVTIQNRLDSEYRHLNKTSTKILRALRLIGTKENEAQIHQLLAQRENVVLKIKNRLSIMMSDILKEVDQIGVNDKYLVHTERMRLQSLLDEAKEVISRINDGDFVNNVSISLKNYNDYISSYNMNYIRSRKKQYSELFNSHVHLDDQQQEAIIKDDKFNLVIAGAGSGKTEVLITRIAYLIKSEHIQPERILALAYQNRAAREIEKRLEKYDIIGVNSRTFHVLGKDIVEKAIGKKVDGVFNDGDLAKYVWDHYLTPLKDTRSELYNQFLRYIVTINNTTVKSWPEKEIMDFFTTHTLNGKVVVVEYEHRVPVENGLITYFRPDFYLPEFDLFIENWAIDEGEEVPEWFSGSTEDYRNHMKYKINWFEQYNKPYISMYAHEYDKENPEAYIGLLKTRLMEKLKTIKDEECLFTPRSYDEIIEDAWGVYKDPIPQNIINFINIAKTYGLKPKDVGDILSSGDWSLKQRAFGKLALSIYRIYQDFLDSSHRRIEEEPTALLGNVQSYPHR
jgi:DNA helicase-4